MCGQSTSEVPTFPDDITRQLRIDLIREEFIDELIPAMEEENMVEIADALADILYVVYGTAIAYGIPIDEVFDEVHSSNLSKFENGSPVRREDGKILKGKNYFKPDIEKILKEHIRKYNDQ